MDSPARFIIGTGGRPRVSIPNSKWLVGGPHNPFNFLGTLTNGAVTATDLTTADAAYEDAQIRTAYNPTNGDTSTHMDMYVNLEAVRLFVSDGTFAALKASVKDDAGAGLFLTIGIGSSSYKRINLRENIREAAREFQQTEASASLSTWWLLRGTWAVLQPGSHQLYFRQDTCKLESLNQPAYGADISQAWVQIVGHVLPNDSGCTSYIPGLAGCQGTPAFQPISDPTIIASYNGLPPMLSAMPQSLGSDT